MKPSSTRSESANLHSAGAHGASETPAPKVPEHAGTARERLAGLGRRVSGGIRTARTGAARLVERAPETMHAFREAATDLTTTLQKAPDSTLRWLAATSVGVGAGFYLRRSPRLLVAAGVLPAVVMGAAMALRPDTAPTAQHVGTGDVEERGEEPAAQPSTTAGANGTGPDTAVGSGHFGR